MSENEKIKILSDVFENIENMNEIDRVALMAYIKGTQDTRERVNMENDNNMKI
ncbi:Uncharacterised protein [[Clostridium] sordellii]|uniref:hypothetical protein n=1 Tax=Paraclostridium sordellii TaxID=1505 RepID=UPI0005E4D10E|nr:hypothetical protein [Paeniclostridium sordellii]CEP39601.1 Uncharacterised protein [[Clostridium] sordellii] [Paeniclostridium sordellii]